MERLRKVLAILLIVGLSLGIAACSPSTTESTPPTETSEPATNSAGSNGGAAADADSAASVPSGEPNEFGWVKPAETLTISVYGGEGDQQTFLLDEKGGKAVFDAWLLENMNVVVDWNTYSNSMDEKLNMMLAAGDYPEVITNMTDDMANKFAAQKRALELSNLLNAHGDNITRRLGDYLNLLRADNGELYKLPTLWGETPNVAGMDFGIRYDYWKELGESGIYTTPQEYYETLKKVLANHPTNDSGEKTYAITATNGASDQGTTMLKAMLAAYGFTSDGYLHGDDGSFTYWLKTEQGREISLLMNQMWLEGMIDPDYLSNTYEDYIAKMASGQIIGNLGTWWYAWVGGHEKWAVEDENYNIDKRFMNVSVAGPGLSMDDTRLLSSNFVGSYRAIITDKCEQAEAVMSFINWQNSELGNMITGWGAPAETNNWHIDSDGMWIVSDDIMNVSQKNLYYHETKEQNGGNIYPISVAGGWLKSDGRSTFDKIDPRVDRVSIYDYWPVNPADGSFSDEGVNICWGNYTAPAYDTTLYTVTFDPESPVTQVNQTIKDSLPTYWASIMTAADADACMKAFDNAMASVEALGIAEVEEFYSSSYEMNKTKLGS